MSAVDTQMYDLTQKCVDQSVTIIKFREDQLSYPTPDLHVAYPAITVLSNDILTTKALSRDQDNIKSVINVLLWHKNPVNPQNFNFRDR